MMKCEIRFKNGSVLKFTYPDGDGKTEGLINMVGNFESRYDAAAYQELPISKAALAAIIGGGKK